MLKTELIEIRNHIKLNKIQLNRAREIKDQVIFPDPVSAAIYLKTIAQAENAFTLLDLLVLTYPERVAQILHEALIEPKENHARHTSI